MRKVTIIRDKSLVGGATKAKVYLKDKSGDTFIAHDECRYIASLKNNDSITFDIDENVNTVYIIYDAFSKDFCFGKKVIPVGTHDVVLHGKPKFAPFGGNPFVFAD